MDHTDQKILAALARNARLSFAALGREIGLSRTAVQDRVGRLEQSGVITGYVTEYNAEAAGLVSAVLFVRIAARPCDPALTWLASLSGIEEVLSISGEIDALVRCRVPAHRIEYKGKGVRARADRTQHTQRGGAGAGRGGGEGHFGSF